MVTVTEQSMLIWKILWSIFNDTIQTPGAVDRITFCLQQVIPVYALQTIVKLKRTIMSLIGRTLHVREGS